jgi:hypothetical protein
VQQRLALGYFCKGVSVSVSGVGCLHWSDRRVGTAGACVLKFVYGCERAGCWVGVRVYRVFCVLEGE